MKRASLNDLVLLAIVISSICIVVVHSKKNFTCQLPGKFPHPDPTKFYECYILGHEIYTHLEQKCPIDNCFDADSQSCRFSDGSCLGDGGEMMTSNPVGFTCPHSGKFRHPDVSRTGSYIKCLEIGGKIVSYEYQCLPTKPCFNEKEGRCIAGEPCK